MTVIPVVKTGTAEPGCGSATSANWAGSCTSALGVYERLLEAGEAYGLANAGYRAIESLRLEKGYRAWGSDIGPDHTPLEAGLGWAVKLRKNVSFKGRDALVAQQAAPLEKRLACFAVDNPSVVLLGGKTFNRNGRDCGWLTSAGWGYTVEPLAKF